MLCDVAVHIWICSFYLRLEREAGKRVEGPGDLFLVLSQSHRAGAVHQNSAFLQQTHCLQSCENDILQSVCVKLKLRQKNRLPCNIILIMSDKLISYLVHKMSKWRKMLKMMRQEQRNLIEDIHKKEKNLDLD